MLAKLHRNALSSSQHSVVIVLPSDCKDDSLHELRLSFALYRNLTDHHIRIHIPDHNRHCSIRRHNFHRSLHSHRSHNHNLHHSLHMHHNFGHNHSPGCIHSHRSRLGIHLVLLGHRVHQNLS